MSDHKYRPEVEILSVIDSGRRRRWTDAEKVRIVEESLGGRGQVSATGSGESARGALGIGPPHRRGAVPSFMQIAL